MIRLCLLVFFLWAGRAAAQPNDVFIYAATPAETGLDNGYVWRVLREALDHTRPTYGEYRLEAIPSMPDRRQIHALARGEPPLTVGAFTADSNVGRELAPVRIPVERGLLGYRVLLVRKADLGRFAQVSSLEDLRSFRFGLMPVWGDWPVMAAAGLQVVPGESHEGLFRMLAAGRFDAFSRGVAEILPEYDYAGREVPGLAVEPHLLLHYPLPIYFYFSPDAAGRRRAERVEAGLRAMVADGSLKKLFDAEYGGLEARLDLGHRQVIELANPSLEGSDPLDEPGLWFRPH